MRIVESLAINCRFSSQNLLCPSAIVGDRYERIMIFTVIRFQISFVIMPDDRHAFLPSLEFAGNSVRLAIRAALAVRAEWATRALLSLIDAIV